MFCPNRRTRDAGEHIWDDWLNRLNGRPVRTRYTVTEYGRKGTVLRVYHARRMEAAKAVVCDECNHTWMSDITNHTKATIEGFIRYERAATLLELGIVTIVAFAFMKSAVLDYSVEDARNPYISRAMASRFRESLCSPHGVLAIPDGVQVWLAWYRARQLETQFWIDGFTFTEGVFRGYRVMVITYMVGHFAFQLTYPRWTERTRRRAPIPLITQARFWDEGSVLIWPNPMRPVWPPPKYLNRAALEDFRKRFRKLRVPRTLK